MNAHTPTEPGAAEEAKRLAEVLAFFKSREVEEDMPKMSAVRMAGIFKLLEQK